MTSPQVRLRQALQRHPDGRVAVHSAALITTYGVTAATGILFWAIAARMMSPQSLGIDTALLSLITAAGMVAAIGTGNSFTALLPIRDCDRRRRLADGYVIVATIATVLGVGAGIFASATLHLGTVTAVCLTTLGSLATAFYIVKDSAMVGLGGTVKLLFQNFGASLGKLALFPLLVLTAWHPAVLATVASSAATAAVAIALIIPRLVTTGAHSVSTTINLGPTRRDVAVFTLRDGLGSAMVTGIFVVLPFLTTSIAGAAQGAVLALTLSFSLSLELVSAGVGTALTAGLSAAPERLWDRGRRAWFATQAIVILVALTLLAAGPLIVRMLGPQYRGFPVIPILGILMAGFAARVAFVIWSSVLRSLSRTKALLKANASATAIALPLIILCTANWGAMGAAIGLSVTSTVMGIMGATGLLTGGNSRAPRVHKARLSRQPPPTRAG
jgi:O-antigen/teichoic acid export membrane protein